MQFKDYYRILGIEDDATAAEIKAAYRKLARRYHPDVSKLKNAEERFKEVLEAYETLKDPCKRTRYDRFDYCAAEGLGLDWERQFGEFFCRDEGPSACGLDDLLRMFKSGAAQDACRGFAEDGKDVEITAQITLEEAAFGTQLELELPRAVTGSESRSIRICVARGTCDGQVLRVAGAGCENLPGDVFVKIAIRPHPLFRIEGHDLTLDVPLTPSEAALGTSLEVPTLDGRVRLRVPPGTPSHQRLRLAARGLPKPDGGAGDLYAQIRIVTPSVLSERERELYAELARACSFEPRGHFA